MKPYTVCLYYDRRTSGCPIFEVEVQAENVMQAKAVARQIALKVFSTECPINVVVEEGVHV